MMKPLKIAYLAALLIAQYQAEYAMMPDTEAVASHKPVEPPQVYLKLKDGSALVETRLAKASLTLKNLLEDQRIMAGQVLIEVPLLEITTSTWQHIQDQLEKALIIFLALDNVEGRKDIIIQEYKALEARDLIELLAALNYLNIPALISCCHTAALERGIEGADEQTLLALPAALRNPLVSMHAIANLGSVQLKGDWENKPQGTYVISGWWSEMYKRTALADSWRFKVRKNQTYAFINQTEEMRYAPVCMKEKAKANVVGIDGNNISLFSRL